jgi:hypothetical protein
MTKPKRLKNLKSGFFIAVFFVVPLTVLALTGVGALIAAGVFGAIGASIAATFLGKALLAFSAYMIAQSPLLFLSLQGLIAFTAITAYLNLIALSELLLPGTIRNFFVWNRIHVESNTKLKHHWHAMAELLPPLAPFIQNKDFPMSFSDKVGHFVFGMIRVILNPLHLATFFVGAVREILCMLMEIGSQRYEQSSWPRFLMKATISFLAEIILAALRLPQVILDIPLRLAVSVVVAAARLVRLAVSVAVTAAGLVKSAASQQPLPVSSPSFKAHNSTPPNDGNIPTPPPLPPVNGTTSLPEPEGYKAPTSASAHLLRGSSDKAIEPPKDDAEMPALTIT